MSETNTPAPTEALPNAPSVDPPAPAPEPAPAPAPAPAATDPPEQTEEEQASKGDRRFAALSARTAALQRERDQLAAEAAFLRSRNGGPPPADPTPEQQQAALREQIRAEEAGKLRAKQFHEQGRAEYPDWQQRCAELMKMGADPGFAALLVNMRGGPKVAAALVEAPEEIQRIASLETEQDRAVELGRFAATLEAVNGTPRPQSQPVTRAPAPVRPVTGRASPQFNEYTASAQDLVDHYLKPTPIRR